MNERIREIALRFFEGTITAEEECELYGFLNGNPQGLAQMREWESCWKRDHGSAGRRARFARFAEAEDSAAASAAPSVAAYLGCGRGAGARLDARAASPSGRKARTAFYGRGAAGHAQPYLAARRYAGVAQCGIGVELRIEFQRTSREVSLSGEAYFEVARHAALPFRVEARGCTFTVLGTKFDISAYAEDPA